MTMNQKEYKLFEYYKNIATEYERKFEKLKKIKTYLELSIEIDNNKEYEKILTFLDKTFDI